MDVGGRGVAVGGRGVGVAEGVGVGVGVAVGVSVGVLVGVLEGVEVDVREGVGAGLHRLQQCVHPQAHHPRWWETQLVFCQEADLR